jgi:hypothetical protein
LSDMRFLLMRGAALALVGVRNPRGCGLHLTYAARFSADLELWESSHLDFQTDRKLRNSVRRATIKQPLRCAVSSLFNRFQ